MLELAKYLLDRLKDVRPVTTKVGGVDYAVRADGTIGAAVRALEPQWTAPTLTVGSLSAIVIAYKQGIDDLETESVALHVVDIYTVELIALTADEYGKRHVFARAKHHEESAFNFGAWYKPEDFLIAFRAGFLFNDEAVKVQQVCSNVGSGEAVLVTDDGVSQEITIKSGAVTRSTIHLPAEGIPLIPWRTFRDANPVESRFLLRMKGVKDELPKVALFEIDAKWKLDTIGAIEYYLQTTLPEAVVIA